MKDLFPRRHALTEKHLITAAAGPVFTVNRTDSPGIFFDPGHGVGTSVDTSSDVQLEHYGLVRVLSNHLDGFHSADGHELEFVIVIARFKIVRSKFLTRFL